MLGLLCNNIYTLVSSTLDRPAGMEAVWKIEVENFPAFIVVDDKGEDFFEEWLG